MIGQAHRKPKKLPPKESTRIPLLTRYATRHSLAKHGPIGEYDWISKVRTWGELGNEKAGDCAEAAPGHSIQSASTYASGVERIVTGAEVLAAYSAITGYDPTKPETDRGSYLVDVLHYWQRAGIAGRKILGAVQIPLGDGALLQRAIGLFGGVIVGYALPNSAKYQTAWDVAEDGVGAQPGSWGGHAVWLGKAIGSVVGGVTWGEPIDISMRFQHAYCDEAYAVIDEDFVNGDFAPNGLDLETLLRDLRSMGDAVTA